jgi:transcriptional regulator with XRE-family HTH domain
VADDVQTGRIVRDLRISRGLRQEDVASRAGLSRKTVSRLERGLIDAMTVASLRAISRALGMTSIVSLGWRSPEVDRLRDRLHSAMVEQMASILSATDWQTKVEHSFNHFGERGSIDILAWHPACHTLLIVEIKTRLWDIQDLLSTMDKKRRLMPGLVARDFGWKVRTVGALLVLPEMSTHRHVIDRHAATFRAALPQRQREVRDWLADPATDLRGILFLPIAHHVDIGQRSRRMRASTHRPGSSGQGKGASKGPKPSPQGSESARFGSDRRVMAGRDGI